MLGIDIFDASILPAALVSVLAGLIFFSVHAFCR